MTSRTLLELRTTVDCIRDADIVFQPYSPALTRRPEVFRAVELSHLRIWIRSTRSWEDMRLQLELSVCEDRYKADMDRLQGEATQREGEMTQMRADLAQRQRDLDSRDAELAHSTATIRRLEEQLQGVGIPPVTGAGSSGFGQTSSLPPTDPVSRDWFFDDPPSS
jgi:hypothetical protein